MIDEPTWTTIRLALRRSRVRISVLLALLRMGPSYSADLARGAGSTPQRTLDALHGNGRDYKIQDSLIPLGLVETQQLRDQIRYVLTPMGREVATGYQRETLAVLSGRPRARS